MNEFQLEVWPERVRSFQPSLGIVLGSGLGSMVEHIEVSEEIPYNDIAGHPVSTVPGHAGKYVFGEISRVRVVLAMGRVHLYEGHPAATVAAGVRALAALGVRKFILTNAAGTANPEFQPGSWMMLSDHINLSGQSPLTGDPHFADMSCVYTKRMRDIFSRCSMQLGMPLHEGVYLSVPGPQYETPAEVRAYRLLGADAIGMSTVNEAIQARALDMEVAGFSCLTNWAAGMGQEELHHGEVMETGKAAAAGMIELLRRALPEC